MRNLKRALSLALASVMVMGLAVVGSNASYVDVTSKQNQEAIEVLQKVGIMVGDENGKFNPEAKVTRNEMAVIMANLMDYRVSNYKGTSPFTDVPAWAEPYVAACFTNGIVSGYDAKTFGGNDSVATSQAALMLMKALGYFQYQSDFADDWQLSTIKQGNKIDLFDDVASNVKEAMTRNDVAQLVLNALKSGTVEADDDTIKVVTGDTKVEAGKVKYNYITSGKDYADAIDSKLGAATGADQISGNIVQLGEKLYNGDLKLKGANDNFGAPSNRWTYKNEEIGTYAKSPDYTFSGVVKSNAFYDAVGKTVADASQYTWTVYVDGGVKKNATYDYVEGYLTKDSAGNDVYHPSSDMQTAVKKNNKEDLDATVRGSNTYVYLDDSPFDSRGNRRNPTATVVVKNTYIAEITKVKDGTITIDDHDAGALDFDTTGYSEGDMVLYTRVGNAAANYDVKEVLGKAELKEGTVETVRDQDRIVIDGTTYKYAAKFNPDVDSDKLDIDSVDQKVSFYLDGQGNIIAFEDANMSQDYAFVYSVGEANSQFNKDSTDYGAKLVMTDGTVKSVVIDSDDTDKAIGTTTNTTSNPTAQLDKVKNAFCWKIVSYSVNDDGTYSLTVKENGTGIKAELAPLTVGDDIIKTGTARVKGTSVSADKNTVYLINERTDDGDDFNVYVGYNNVPNISAKNGADYLMGQGSSAIPNGSKNDTTSGSGVVSTTGYAAYIKDGVAKVIVVTDADVSGSSNDVVFVVGNKSAKLNKSGSTEYYVYDAVVNGEVTSIRVKNGSEAQKALWDNAADDSYGKTVAVFFGMTKNSAGYVTKFTTTTPKDVEVNGRQNRDAGKPNTAAQSVVIADKFGIGEYKGTKRESNGGNLTFNTASGLTKQSYAANDKALIVYYDGEDLSVVKRVNTDTDDRATVITDDESVIAILVREIENSKLSHG